MILDVNYNITNLISITKIVKLVCSTVQQEKFLISLLLLT